MDLRPERRMMSMMFLSLLIHVIGSLEAAADYTCSEAFKSKRLISPEKLTNITHNVESRFWYKDENLVSWINEKGFKEGKGYEGRLRHVGDGNIEIKNVTRNDSGIYQSISKFRGVSNTLTASVNLQVIDAPARDCKPEISREGSNLKANLPLDDVCTTSQLRLEWINTNKTVTTQNGTTILDPGTDSGGREYMVCAVGEATKCFQGNVSDFCTNYTVPQHQQSDDGDALRPAEVAIIIIIVIAIGVIILCVLGHKGIICKKSSQRGNEFTVRASVDIEQELGNQSTQAQKDVSTPAPSAEIEQIQASGSTSLTADGLIQAPTTGATVSLTSTTAVIQTATSVPTTTNAQREDVDRAKLAQTEDDDRATLAQTEDDDRATLAQTEDDDRATLVPRRHGFLVDAQGEDEYRVLYACNMGEYEVILLRRKNRSPAVI